VERAPYWLTAHPARVDSSTTAHEGRITRYIEFIITHHRGRLVQPVSEDAVSKRYDMWPSCCHKVLVQYHEATGDPALSTRGEEPEGHCRAWTGRRCTAGQCSGGTGPRVVYYVTSDARDVAPRAGQEAAPQGCGFRELYKTDDIQKADAGSGSEVDQALVNTAWPRRPPP